MSPSHSRWLLPIILLGSAAAYIALSGVIPAVGSRPQQTLVFHQGLDMQGGLQVLLEADVPNCAAVDTRAMEAVKFVVDQRVNALGVAEPLVQRQGACRVVVELPGLKDPQQAIDTIQQTALLEFVDLGSQTLPAGTLIATDCADPSTADCSPGAPLILESAPLATVPPSPALAEPATAPATEAASAPATPAGPIYHTVMTGAALRDASVTSTRASGLGVSFELNAVGSKIFADFTAQHVGQILAIVLDKHIISAPRIDSAITGGSGIISGQFTLEAANQLAVQLRSGALPVPLKLVRSREVGPTLGQDSIRQSLVAGIVGLSVVALYMLLYYRLPGAIADLALVIYAFTTLALYKIIPVTLTLPGIAGFVLSVGVAVDANILIFERMKEELRAGRHLPRAVEAGFSRAWPSIRDSNVSTLITCFILFWFGSAFGASIVKGFALTLALGVGVSLFTAVLVTRSILHVVLDRVDFSRRHAWFGI